eukprot:4407556-Alexandrium_andersonii.AAC.1
MVDDLGKTLKLDPQEMAASIRSEADASMDDGAISQEAFAKAIQLALGAVQQAIRTVSGTPLVNQPKSDKRTSEASADAAKKPR